jgi:pSer/pThr/pTyr-binding forkhead associated (FHA) protein
MIMGRGVSTDITLWDIRCSRAHCRIDRRGDAYQVSDLNSSNGTYVNGQKLKAPHRLQAGDMIKLGASVLQFSP